MRAHYTIFPLPFASGQFSRKMQEVFLSEFDEIVQVFPDKVILSPGMNFGRFLDVFSKFMKEHGLNLPPCHLSSGIERGYGTEGCVAVFPGEMTPLFFSPCQGNPFLRHCEDFLGKAGRLLEGSAILEDENLLQQREINRPYEDVKAPAPHLFHDEASIAHAATIRLPDSWGQEAGRWLNDLLNLLYQKDMPKDNDRISTLARIIREDDVIRLENQPESVVFQWPYLILPPDSDHSLFEEAVSSTMRQFDLDQPEHGFSYVLYCDEEDSASYGSLRIFEHKRGKGVCCASYDLPSPQALPGTPPEVSLAVQLIGDASSMAWWAGDEDMEKKITSMSKKLLEQIHASLESIRHMESSTLMQ